MINLFPVHDKIDHEEVVRVGKLKSALFLGAFLLAVLLAAIFYSIAEQTITKTAVNPSYSEYNDLVSSNDIVQCECGNVSHTIGSFTQVQIPPDSFCTTAVAKLTMCQGYYTGACPGTSTESFFKSLIKLCEMSLGTIAQQLSGVENTLIVTEQLLHNDTLEQRVFSTGEIAVATSQSILSANHKLIDAMNAIDRPLLYTAWEVNDKQWDATGGDAWEYEVGAVKWPSAVGSDGNTDCICADNWSCQKIIDLSNDVGGTGIRYCSIFETIMKNPVKVWSSETFFRQGIDFNVDTTDANTLQQFPEIGNLYTDDLQYGILWPSSSDYYDEEFRTMFQDGMSGNLGATVNHETYYDLCAPKKCEYTSTRSRSGIEILAVLAGLIGGFKVAIDMLVNLCCMKQSKKAMASFKTERESQREMLRKSQMQLTENRESEIKVGNDTVEQKEQGDADAAKYTY